MESALLPYAVAIIGGLFASLVAIVGWVGSQINIQLRDMAGRVDSISKTLSNIERDLRGDLSDLDRRVTRIEARCEAQHEEDDI
jgi:hypothetical protein